MSSTLAEQGTEQGQGSTSSTGTIVEDTAISFDPPRRYYLEKLWELAPHFWSRPQSADCTLVLHHTETSTSTYHVHIGYVATQSSVLYNAFLGRHNPNLSPLSSSSYSTPLPSPPPSPNFPPRRLGARRDLKFKRPTVHLTLPDPTSFDLILHFLYWGDASVVEHALDDGLYSAEKLIDNLRVLNIDSRLKLVVGKWWMANKPSTATECVVPPRQTRLLTPPLSDSDSQSGEWDY